MHLYHHNSTNELAGAETFCRARADLYLVQEKEGGQTDEKENNYMMYNLYYIATNHTPNIKFNTQQNI